MKKRIKPGKFIVIDGTDGSGKSTQTKMLVRRLKKAGCNVALSDFPQYGKKSAGLVEEYLNGNYGSAQEVGPYRASVFYAVDRYDAGFRIKKWLSRGKIVISNRYVTSNLAHQGGKIENAAKRKKYFKWLDALEYGLFAIPRPDLTLILHVDAAVAQKLVDKKGAREYVHGKKRDIHEDDLKHLRHAERVYLEIARTFPKIKIIECTKNDRIISRREIAEMVWTKIMKIL